MPKGGWLRTFCLGATALWESFWQSIRPSPRRPCNDASNMKNRFPPPSAPWQPVRIDLLYDWLRMNSSSMALSARHKPVIALQGAFPRGAPFDTAQLRSVGISPALAHHYLKAGWLDRLGRGVFMFPHDRLQQNASLAFLARSIEGFHVGGKTALAWRGIRHNLPAREPLSLWGGRKFVLPAWLVERFPARYTAPQLFAARLPKGFGLRPLPEDPNGVAVSEPERALLEMLSEVGVHQGIEEARSIMEGARALRPEVLTTLLKQCQRVKVRTLCLQWADTLNLPWASDVRKGLGKRQPQRHWNFQFKNGTTLSLKP